MPRRVLEGKVVKDKQDKTITVAVERRIMHPLYKKFVKKTKKFTAHDENNAYKVGDFVQIEECRPLSRKKRFRVLTETPANDQKAAKSAPEKKAEKATEEKAEKEEASVKKPAAKKESDKKETAAKKPTAKKKSTAKKTTKKDEK